MSEEISVAENVKEFVNDLVKKYNLSTAANITYNRGSELGDGFMSKTYAVDIGDDNEKINLFLKCSLNIKFPDGTSFENIYRNEIYFYEAVVPAFTEFLAEKGIEDGFRNVAKCYGSVEESILALENVKKKGYELCDKELVGNEEHIELVFRTYAKFHAISFAFKDQKAEEYSKLADGIMDLLAGLSEEFDKQRVDVGKLAINDFLQKLDPRKDKFILDQSQLLTDKLIEFSLELGKIKYTNPIIIQGDCWCNNMLFKYKDDKKYPLDVILVDWQVVRQGSPALDLAYFFYTAASGSKKILRKIEDYLEIYHDELSIQIRKMGSDPDKVYPLSLLKREWQHSARYGFSMAFLILKAMLAEKEDMPNFEQIDMMDAMKTDVIPTTKRESEYISRLKNIAEHFLLNEFL